MMQETSDGKHIPELVGSIASEAERLVQLNIELAKTEMKQLAKDNGLAAGFFASAALLALFAVLVWIPAVLALFWTRWVAVAWLAVLLVGSAVLLLLGRLKLRVEAPRHTLESLQETKEWAIRLTRSSER